MKAVMSIVVVAVAAAGCTHLFFQPGRIEVATPDQFGIAYEDVRFATSDELSLHGWFLPARGVAKGTIVQLHGNAENISTHFHSVAWLPARGYNVFTFDYRGYGDSQGTPDLAGVQHDIDAAVALALARGDGRRIVIYGQSLGGALAAYYAAHSSRRDQLSALIIESAFSGYRAIAREKLADHWLTWPFQWVPLLAVDDDYSPLPAMPAISPIPVLILQGDRDEIVPEQHAERLYAAAREPRQLWIVPGAGHIQTMRGAAERDRLVAWLDALPR